MKLISQINHRRSIRLKGYDYAQSVAYFITIVVNQRKCLFGEIEHEEMKLSPCGEIARAEWFKTMELRSNVKLRGDEFIIMPNHIHGIVWVDENEDVGARRRKNLTDHIVAVGAERGSAPTKMPHVVKGSLGAIVRAYKSAVTYAINEMRGTRGALIWQRNYYEHVIRIQADLENIYKHIQSNPIQWEKDEENPEWINRH